MSFFDTIISSAGSLAKTLSPVSGLIQGGMSLLGGMLTNQQSASNASSAQAFSADQFAHRYQTQVEDMKAAGLNPMLSYSQSPGAAPGGFTAPVTNAMGSGVDAYQRANMNSAQVANVHADTENKKAQADLIAAQAAQAWASAGQSTANTSLINTNVEKVKAEISKLKGDTNFETQQEILRNTAWMIYQQGAQAQERGISEGQSRAVMAATIKKIAAETDLTHLDIDAAKALDNLGRTSAQLKPVIDMLRLIFRR